jgi:ketosteroid isomerase-like protein
MKVTMAQLRRTLINELIDKYVEMFQAMDDEELFDLYKEKVVGLVKVNGEWTNGNTL